MLPSKTALRLLMLGMFVSAVGTSLSSMGFFLLAAQTGRSSLLAAVLVANLLPSILLGLVGGYIADRYLTWWLWPLSLLFTAGIMTTMAITLRWEVIIAGCALMSSCTALYPRWRRERVLQRHHKPHHPLLRARGPAGAGLGRVPLGRLHLPACWVHDRCGGGC
ncbi:hypothetical protein [Rothia nasimurium]|uniref:hypothetical protein n=1 Tax=Rothia nasimurium TaxID=85336 RepID=UPI002DD6A772|nr:hypothetical protein [Rothia nasimurium]